MDSEYWIDEAQKHLTNIVPATLGETRLQLAQEAQAAALIAIAQELRAIREQLGALTYKTTWEDGEPLHLLTVYISDDERQEVQCSLTTALV
jgi:hypothetical protein